MPGAPSRADGHVAIAIGVHEEDFGAIHPAADAQAEPGVRGRCAHLEIDVALARLDSGLWDAPAEAQI